MKKIDTKSVRTFYSQLRRPLQVFITELNIYRKRKEAAQRTLIFQCWSDKILLNLLNDYNEKNIWQEVDEECTDWNQVKFVQSKRKVIVLVTLIPMELAQSILRTRFYQSNIKKKNIYIHTKQTYSIYLLFIRNNQKISNTLEKPSRITILNKCSDFR